MVDQIGRSVYAADFMAVVDLVRERILSKIDGDFAGLEWRAEQHVFFFFSSRRRHTRFDCDWSSDVCSSDLRKSSQLATRMYRPTVAAIGSTKPASSPTVSLISPRAYDVRNSSTICSLLGTRSEEHTSELQSQSNLVCRLLLEKKNLVAISDH